ncbi:NIPSNAP family protein [Nonomuraea sp. NPDC050310]|uniref:NIPSNAP family protein n=1 Tax=unclassified Nonomuraea TaxID=2593643 RepID=UPI0033C18259
MIYEFRQYTLHPGVREEFVRLFERHFVESQEEAGISLVGIFTDLDRPDAFVWMRAFPDMEARRVALEEFYLRGAAWREHRDAANGMMIDSDDVLLLRLDGVPVVPGGAGPVEAVVAPAAVEPGGAAVVFEGEHSVNTFPRLPVREGEDVRLWLGRGLSAPPEALQHLRLLPTSRSPIR